MGDANVYREHVDDDGCVDVIDPYVTLSTEEELDQEWNMLLQAQREPARKAAA